MGNFISFDKLNTNDFFLGRRSFSTNKWELCKVLSLIPELNTFGDKFIYIRFLDGHTKIILITDNGCSDNFGEDVLRELSQKYIDGKINKINKLREDISEIEKELNLLGYVI